MAAKSTRQRLAELVKLIGPKAAFRENKNAPTAEKRVALRERFNTIKAQNEEAKKRVEDRRRELLRDPDYRQLVSAQEAIDAEFKKVRGSMLHYRFEAGTSSPLIFSIVAQADTWPELIKDIHEKKG